MVAHGDYLRKNLNVSGGADIARSNIQSKNLTIAQPSSEDITRLKKSLYDTHINPIIEKYYLHYQSQKEIKYVIFRL